MAAPCAWGLWGVWGTSVSGDQDSSAPAAGREHVACPWERGRTVLWVAGNRASPAEVSPPRRLPLGT